MPDKENTGTNLFVYGSLRKGAKHAAHSVLDRYGEYLCRAKFSGDLYMVDGYPAAVDATGDTNGVLGEIYSLKEPDQVFRSLDHYEGYYPKRPDQSLYIRKIRTFYPTAENEQTVTGWIYLYNRPTDSLQKIPSGDYLSFTGKREM